MIKRRLFQLRAIVFAPALNFRQLGKHFTDDRFQTNADDHPLSLQPQAGARLAFGLPLRSGLAGRLGDRRRRDPRCNLRDPANADPGHRSREGRSMNSALVIIALTAILALALGLAARRGVRMTLEQWTVGGRGFGAPLVFLLTAGEIYTTFTFLGGSGYAYGRGAPAYYILAYGTLAYILSYWLLPPIWRYARRARAPAERRATRDSEPVYPEARGSLCARIGAWGVSAAVFFLE